MRTRIVVGLIVVLAAVVTVFGVRQYQTAKAAEELQGMRRFSDTVARSIIKAAQVNAKVREATEEYKVKTEKLALTESSDQKMLAWALADMNRVLKRSKTRLDAVEAAIRKLSSLPPARAAHKGIVAARLGGGWVETLTQSSANVQETAAIFEKYGKQHEDLELEMETEPEPSLTAILSNMERFVRIDQEMKAALAQLKVPPELAANNSGLVAQIDTGLALTGQMMAAMRAGNDAQVDALGPQFQALETNFTAAQKALISAGVASNEKLMGQYDRALSKASKLLRKLETDYGKRLISPPLAKKLQARQAP